MNPSKGISVAFPIRRGSARGNIFAFDQTDSESIKSRLVLLLTTERGERLFFPEYGSELKKSLFDPNDPPTHSEIKNEIDRTVTDNFNEVKVGEIGVEQDGTSVLITVPFTYTEATLTFTDSVTIRFE